MYFNSLLKGTRTTINMTETRIGGRWSLNGQLRTIFLFFEEDRRLPTIRGVCQRPHPQPRSSQCRYKVNYVNRTVRARIRGVARKRYQPKDMGTLQGVLAPQIRTKQCTQRSARQFGFGGMSVQEQASMQEGINDFANVHAQKISTVSGLQH